MSDFFLTIIMFLRFRKFHDSKLTQLDMRIASGELASLEPTVSARAMVNLRVGGLTSLGTLGSWVCFLELKKK